MKKEWTRRTQRDDSQQIRAVVQGLFLALNVWIGLQFFLFVRQFERGGIPSVDRPPGVEGWLPIAGMMNTKYFLLTGEVPLIHPAAMVLFIAFLAISLLLRKAFCGWLCPVGTLSERLWKLGRETFGRNLTAPKWLDLAARSLKYLLLGAFLYAVGSMRADDIRAFLHSPYGLVADVQMLNFFRHLSVTAAVVLAVLIAGSVFVRHFWCRYLCPYGALMGLAALASPLRIRRNAEACIDCARCAKACPSHLPVDRLVQIRSAECLGCMECVAACPAEGAIAMYAGPRPVRPRMMAAVLALLLAGFVGLAQWSGHWDSPIPGAVYESLIRRAGELGHR